MAAGESVSLLSYKARYFLGLILVFVLLLGLYFSEGHGAKWLVTILNYLAGLSGLLFFAALCGCLFVSESTRQRRMSLCVFGLGSCGFWMALSEWLSPDVAIACDSLRRIRWMYCVAIENSPQFLQGMVAFAGLVIVVVVSAWLAQMGWNMYRYRALR